MLRRFLKSLLLLAVLSVLLPSLALAADLPLKMHLFWQQGCPYCEGAKEDLGALAARAPRVHLVLHELAKDANTEQLYEAVLTHFGYRQAAVPLVVIGDRSFLGYFEGGHSAKQYEDAVTRCLSTVCRDALVDLAEATSRSRTGIQPVDPSPPTYLIPTSIEVPFLGPVQLAKLSLPVLTVVLAAIDGFNPCAMWVLVFLIGLLLGMENEKRMWILGGAFLGATGMMYFAVMTAWLNVFLFIGAVVWVRTMISLLAIGGGLYFLKEYWAKPEAVCHVTNPGRRQKIMAAFRGAVQENRLLLSVIGVMTLAVLVNVIELLCSAGIPAVFTQILAMNELPVAINYLYVGVYVAVFMLDDILIFATAMLALRVSGLTGTYARYSHLIGGVVLLSIGAIMLLRPEFLTIT